MLDNKIKERIAQEAKSNYPMRSTGTLNNYPVKWLQEENQKAYAKGAEAEALDRVKRQCLACGWREEVRDSVINDILKGAEQALTNYNNPVNK